MGTPTRLRFITPQGRYTEIAYTEPEFGDFIDLMNDDAALIGSSIDIIAERFYEAMIDDDVWKSISYEVLMVLMVPVNRLRANNGLNMIIIPKVEDFIDNIENM